MMVSAEQLDAWLTGREDAHLEFKEAKAQYDSEKLTKYCVALANQGSGSDLGELKEVLPGLSVKQIQHLLSEMKTEGLAHVLGVTKGAKWYPGPETGERGRP